MLNSVCLDDALVRAYPNGRLKVNIFHLDSRDAQRSDRAGRVYIFSNAFSLREKAVILPSWWIEPALFHEQYIRVVINSESNKKRAAGRRPRNVLLLASGFDTKLFASPVQRWPGQAKVLCCFQFISIV